MLRSHVLFSSPIILVDKYMTQQPQIYKRNRNCLPLAIPCVHPPVFGGVRVLRCPVFTRQFLVGSVFCDPLCSPPCFQWGPCFAIPCVHLPVFGGVGVLRSPVFTPPDFGGVRVVHLCSFVCCVFGVCLSQFCVLFPVLHVSLNCPYLIAVSYSQCCLSLDCPYLIVVSYSQCCMSLWIVHT